MKTSKQWWDEVKNDPEKFNDWLHRQYRGEMSAARRISEVMNHFHKIGLLNDQNYDTLQLIQKDEARHAGWIGELLIMRGEEPYSDKKNAEKRFWSVQDLSFQSFSKTMAIGAHAEKMRLERIETIAFDPEADFFIRALFNKILRDELFHERMFRHMAGEAAMAETLPDHEAGRKLLGLEA